ncbi:unnamed protein product, partial [Discosporangium mesarthrocarpum]
RSREKVAKLEKQAEACTQRAEHTAMQLAEVEAKVEGAIEAGVAASRAETRVVRAQAEANAANAVRLEQELSAIRAELERVRRELKQKGQLARNMLAEKDAEIKRLHHGGELPGDSPGGDGGAGVDPSGVSPSGPSDGVMKGFTRGRGLSSGVGESRSLPPSASSSLSKGRSGFKAGGGANGDGAGADISGNSTGNTTTSTTAISNSAAEAAAAAAARQTEQQLLEMARMQAQRDEETGRLRHSLQDLSRKMQEKEVEATAQVAREAELRGRLVALERDRERGAQLTGEYSEDKMKYLKNVVKRFVTAEGSERAGLVPVMSTILCFSPEERREVQNAVLRSGGSSWGASIFGGVA